MNSEYIISASRPKIFPKLNFSKINNIVMFRKDTRIYRFLGLIGIGHSLLWVVIL